MFNRNFAVGGGGLKRLAKWVVAVLQWIWTITEALNLHHISPLSTMISKRIPSKNHVWPQLLSKYSFPKSKSLFYRICLALHSLFTITLKSLSEFYQSPGIEIFKIYPGLKLKLYEDVVQEFSFLTFSDSLINSLESWPSNIHKSKSIFKIKPLS